jgi:hypothetical protein
VDRARQAAHRPWGQRATCTRQAGGSYLIPSGQSTARSGDSVPDARTEREETWAGEAKLSPAPDVLNGSVSGGFDNPVPDGPDGGDPGP